jgi:hypothetical protein
MQARSSEKGQAIVLIVLAIGAILGFAALAIDIGRLYSERRRAQNAADAAALTAAQAAIRGLNFQTAGIDSASLNGFNNDEATNWVTVNNPPISGAYGPDSAFPENVRDQYYQVTITQHVNPIFAQFIYSGNEAVTVEAVTRAVFNNTVSSGNAIHSLSPDSDSLEFKGTVGIHVEGGNIVSNGGGTKNGASGQVQVDVGEIDISGDWNCTGCKSTTVQPDPNVGVPPQLVDEVPQPYCPTKNETWNGVNYYYHPSGLGAGTLQPGIHCIKGDISLTGQNSIIGHGVLLVLLDGGIKVKGGATLDLISDNDIKDKNGYQYGGMVIYAPSSNTSTLTLGGNSGSHFWGTILAPSATCDLGGTAQGAANHTALICNYITFHGTTDINVLYNEAELFHFPAQLDLSQ